MTFQVGKHSVSLSQAKGRWTAALDGRSLAKWYLTDAEAWEAGVREADRIDRDVTRRFVTGTAQVSSAASL